LRPPSPALLMRDQAALEGEDGHWEKIDDTPISTEWQDRQSSMPSRFGRTHVSSGRLQPRGPP
jgi:hypothetical protein